MIAIHINLNDINHYVFVLDNTLDSKLNYVSIRNHLNSQQPQKKLKTDHKTSILFGEMNIRLVKEKYESIKILLDSGASISIVSRVQQ